MILLILGDINSKFEITIAWVHISIYSEVSVSVSVLAETKIFFRFMYRFRPKRKMAVSASFGFGRNEKKPFSRTLIWIDTSQLASSKYTLYLVEIYISFCILISKYFLIISYIFNTLFVIFQHTVIDTHSHWAFLQHAAMAKIASKHF